jgi:hypothetical protein
VFKADGEIVVGIGSRGTGNGHRGSAAAAPACAGAAPYSLPLHEPTPVSSRDDKEPGARSKRGETGADDASIQGAARAAAGVRQLPQQVQAAEGQAAAAAQQLEAARLASYQAQLALEAARATLEWQQRSQQGDASGAGSSAQHLARQHLAAALRAREAADGELRDADAAVAAAAAQHAELDAAVAALRSGGVQGPPGGRERAATSNKGSRRQLVCDSRAAVERQQAQEAATAAAAAVEAGWQAAEAAQQQQKRAASRAAAISRELAKAQGDAGSAGDVQQLQVWAAVWVCCRCA